MATSREIKDNAINGLIEIIVNSVKKNGGRITLQPTYIGVGRTHNDEFDRYTDCVFDYKHSNKNACDESECGLYYSEDWCYDSPIEELDFNQLFEIAKQCENINN